MLGNNIFDHYWWFYVTWNWFRALISQFFNLRPSKMPCIILSRMSHIHCMITTSLDSFRILKRYQVGTNLVSAQLENFFRWNPSGTFRNIPWYHKNNPKKVPGAPSQGFLIFLVFVKNITKLKNWLSRHHFLADFQVSYHFGKLSTARSQGLTASKNLSLDQWAMSISNYKNCML